MAQNLDFVNMAREYHFFPEKFIKIYKIYRIYKGYRESNFSETFQKLFRTLQIYLKSFKSYPQSNLWITLGGDFRLIHRVNCG